MAYISEPLPAGASQTSLEEIVGLQKLRVIGTIAMEISTISRAKFPSEPVHMCVMKLTRHVKFCDQTRAPRRHEYVASSCMLDGCMVGFTHERLSR
jgi:hypothetical protein